MLKLAAQPSFTHDVQIYSVINKSQRGGVAGSLTVEYKILPSDELDELVAKQKELQVAILSLQAGDVPESHASTKALLRENFERVVVSVKGLEIDGKAFESSEAIDWLIDWYVYGQQVLDYYWQVMQNVKKARAKN